MVVGGGGSTLHGGKYFVGPSVVLACFGALIWVVVGNDGYILGRGRYILGDGW